MKNPEIDLGACTLCMGCIEICPEVFVFNDAGYIEIIDLEQYPEDDINEAIKYCPEDCIYWQDE